MAWQFILTDANYVPLGEVLNASERSVTIGLNKVDTASLRVRLDNPLVDALATASGYVKAYRDGVLRFYGPIITAQETADASGATLVVNCAGAGWILTKRLAGKSATGTVLTDDRARIVQSLISTTNAENETGIDVTSGNISAASSVSYTAGPYRPISDIITELSASFDGFDYRILPLDNYVNGAVSSQKVGQFVAYPSIGADQPNAVFEWGSNGRGNVIGYTRTVSRDTQANNVYHYTGNGPDAPGYPTVYALDAASIGQWRLLEDVAQADILDQGLRQALVNEHVKVRAQPRQVIQFSPATDSALLPQLGVDYDLGDRVRARAQYGASVRIDALLRVWGVSFAIDTEGKETPTLTLADE